MNLSNHQLGIVAFATSIAFSSPQAPCAAVIRSRPTHFPVSSTAFVSRDATTKNFRRRCRKRQEEDTFKIPWDQYYLGCARYYFSSPFSTRRTRIELTCENGHDEGGTGMGVETSVDDDDEEAAVENVRRLLPSNILGPPEPLRSLKIGQYLQAFRILPQSSILSDVEDDDDADKVVTHPEYCKETQDNNNQSNVVDDRHEFTIERASQTPSIFLLRNFLTSSECRRIRSMAQRRDDDRDHLPRSPAGTISRERDERARKHCWVAWLPSLPFRSDRVDRERIVCDDIVPNLVASASNILLTPAILSHPTAGVEDLQVLEYGPGGEFVLHHDGESRILTVLYYLNGVGETWFPLADVDDDGDDDVAGEDDDAEDIMEEGKKKKTMRSMPRNRKEALHVIRRRNMSPGKNGLWIRGRNPKVVSRENDSDNDNDTDTDIDTNTDGKRVMRINAGDAIAFYNYLDDGTGRFDWRSIHCGLPTSEVDGATNKWIANHWFRFNYLEGME